MSRLQFQPNSARLLLVALVCTGLMPAVSRAQDDAFLLCANLTDREARLNCLDAALQAAVRGREAAAPPAPEAPATPAVQAPSVPATVTESVPATINSTVTTTAATPPTPPTSTVTEAPATAPAADSATPEPRLLNLFGLINRDGEPEQPVESMQARVAALDYFKPDVLTITLENGQVWRQKYARRYNLREGDDVRIYGTNWGVQFRLEAERFNGFIQVERVR